MSQPKITTKNPSIIKKGDLFIGTSINGKYRPYVVAIVKDNYCYCIALTTSKNGYTLIPHDSRFFRTGVLLYVIYNSSNTTNKK